eukprot:m.286417 g.286417  ORF g.286417 m.286417 type:complete len:929 (-) comp16210_c0_seq2:80-2866(-)
MTRAVPGTSRTAMSTDVSGMLLTIAALFATAVNGQCNPGTWSAQPSMPTAIQEVATAVVGSKMYVMSGSATLVFNFNSNSWSTHPNNRPHSGDHYSAVAVGTRIFLIGGFNNARGKVQIYNTVSQSWTTGPTLPWSAFGSVNAVLLRGEIHACGGLRDGSSNTNSNSNPEDCFRLNPTTLQWTRFASMIRGVDHAAYATDGDHFFIFGGRDSGRNRPDPGISMCQKYTYNSNSWSQCQAMPFGRGGTGNAVFWNGKMLVFGGETNQNDGFANSRRTYQQVGVYTIATNSWSITTFNDMPNGRHGHGPALYDNAVWIAGGASTLGNAAINWHHKLCLPPAGPPTTTAPVPTPALTPSSAPTTAAPTPFAPVSGCSTVVLTGNDDTFCRDECNTVTVGQCTCAFALRNIPAGGSCITVCAGFGMTCAGRHSDAGSSNRCAHFFNDVKVEQCGATGDNDDVCICAKPSAGVQTAVPVTSAPVLPGDTASPVTVPGLTSISFGAAEVVGNLPGNHNAAESQGVGFEGSLYYFGGFSQNWATMNKKSSRYDAGSGAWSSLPDIPLPSDPRTGDGITHMGNAIWPAGRKIILAGGLGLGFVTSQGWPHATSRAEVYALDVDAETWSRLPNLPASRGGLCIGIVGNVLYAFGGGSYGALGNGNSGFFGDHTDTWSLDLTNPSSGWVTRASMHVARNHLGAAVVNGKVYALGGQEDEDEGCSNKNVVEEYNPTTDTWTILPGMPQKLGHIAPSVLYPDTNFPFGILVISGRTDVPSGSCPPPGLNQKFARYFNPATQAWSTVSFPVGGASMVTALIGNHVYFTVRQTNLGGGSVTQKLVRTQMSTGTTLVRASKAGSETSPPPQSDAASSGLAAVGIAMLLVTVVGVALRRRSRDNGAVAQQPNEVNPDVTVELLSQTRRTVSVAGSTRFATVIQV